MILLLDFGGVHYDVVLHWQILLIFLMLAGHGDSTSRNVPTLVRDISGVGQVVCGSAHTLALSADGRTVWSFGSGKL